jgi:hypothetical protein
MGRSVLSRSVAFSLPGLELIAGRGGIIVTKDNTPHISHHISLESFTPHYLSQHETELEEDEEAEPAYYTHPCRCSGEFVITYQDLEDGIDVVGCGGCGEWVRVGYEVVEEQAKDDDHE